MNEYTTLRNITQFAASAKAVREVEDRELIPLWGGSCSWAYHRPHNNCRFTTEWIVYRLPFLPSGIFIVLLQYRRSFAQGNVDITIGNGAPAANWTLRRNDSTIYKMCTGPVRLDEMRKLPRSLAAVQKLLQWQSATQRMNDKTR